MVLTVIIFTIFGLVVSSIFSKGETKDIEKYDFIISQDGMRNKYYDLIGLIEKLSEEMFITRDGLPQIKNLNHVFRSYEKAVNKYCIEISFKREGQIFTSKDVFTLIQVSRDRLEIIYFRKLENLMPQAKQVLPKEVSIQVNFNNAYYKQKEIFKRLLNEINAMYSSSYNFSDLHFKEVYESLIEE